MAPRKGPFLTQLAVAYLLLPLPELELEPDPEAEDEDDDDPDGLAEEAPARSERRWCCWLRCARGSSLCTDFTPSTARASVAALSASAALSGPVLRGRLWQPAARPARRAPDKPDRPSMFSSLHSPEGRNE